MSYMRSLEQLKQIQKTKQILKSIQASIASQKLQIAKMSAR